MNELLAYAPLLLRGAVVTVGLAILSLALATALGILGALGKIGGGLFWHGLVMVYTTVIRGVPDLVLLLLIYFGGQRAVNNLSDVLGFGPFAVSPFVAGVLTIGFIYGAYLTETFRGAFMTIPGGQIEAGRALGLRPFALHWTVTIPQMIRFALPGYANVFQVLVKSTAVVSVIGLSDIVGLANDAGKSLREPFLFLSVVMLFYLLLTWVSTTIFESLERRTARGQTNAR